MDIEKDIRDRLINILEPFFICYHEVNLEINEIKIRCDVLAVTNFAVNRKITIAFEVKSHQNDNPGKLKDAIWQASRYNSAKVKDKKRPMISGLIVDFAAVFPCRGYFWPNNTPTIPETDLINTGMLFLAERLKVGYIFQNQSSRGYEINCGPTNIWNQRDGWKHGANNYVAKDALFEKGKIN